MTQLDFRETFFEGIVKAQLGYVPSIMIAPAHLANGFFRAIGGGYYNNEAQHWAVFAKTDLQRGPNPSRAEGQFVRFTEQQRAALRALSTNRIARHAMSEAFGADNTLFGPINQSSYSLSHARHTTNDNHDRETGQWLCDILRNGDLHPAYDLVHKLLTQVAIRTAPEDFVMSDALSLMSLPFIDEAQKPKKKEISYWPPQSLRASDDGIFQDNIVKAIRVVFDQLAANDERSALKNGKLDTLRRMTTLGCFSVYLHLINIGCDEDHMPMLLDLHKDTRTLKRASQVSFQAFAHSIDSFFRTAIREKLNQFATDGLVESLDGDLVVRHFVEETINWYRNRPKASEASRVEGLKRDCWNFYESYRGETAGCEPLEALSNALTDMIGLVFSAKPYDVARNLGVKIGLLTRGDQRGSKAYELHPDLLEVLIRATLPAGEEWTIKKLAHEWHNRFGLLFGGLGNENELLKTWGIPPIDHSELAANVRQLEQQLELSGYAQRYADGVVLIRVES